VFAVNEFARIGTKKIDIHVLESKNHKILK